MIRRLLMMRLRRHTRLARALAGRAPLASRAAVDQPILWTMGRLANPPRRARAPVFAGLSPEPPAGSVALFPTAPPESVADDSVFSATPAAGDDDPFPTPLPSSVASGDASASAVLSQATQGGGGESAAGARAPVASEEASAVLFQATQGGGGESAAGARAPVASEEASAVLSQATQGRGGESAAGARAPVASEEASAVLSQATGGGGESAAGARAPVATPLPSSVASEEASAVLSQATQGGGGESAAGARAPIATPPPSVAGEEAPAVSSQSATGRVSETHPAEPTTPEAAQAPAFRAPSASPDVSAFDRSPAAWMERLRADDQRRRQATSSITSASRVAPEHLGTFAAALPGKEASLGVSHAPESETHSPNYATSPVAPSAAAGAERAGDVPFIAPHDAGAAQAPSQPVDPAAAIVNAARAWVSQRMQERSSAPVQPQPAPPAAPKPQPQSQTPVEMRVARPPRLVEARPAPPLTGSGSAMGDGARPSQPASTGEKPRETAQPPAETPAFDRSVEAWMERLRADERRRRQKEAAAPSEDHASTRTSQPSPVAPPAMPAQPVGSLRSGGTTWAAPGGEQRQTAPQPAGAPQPGIAASPIRTTRFAPPVGDTLRPATSGGARFLPRSASSAPPLSASNRRFLRAAIGVDPATVRVLRGPEAGRVAAAYRADAVTLGDEVALAPGRGDQTAEGLGLLAHELTHVARQRDPTAIPPIVRPPEQRPGLRPAPPGPATGEEALARAVEAQTIQAARMRFAPPVMPAHTGATAAPAPKAPAPVHSAEPAEDAPAAPERARWGNLPAPWEPLPDWLAPSGPAAEAPLLPVMTIAPAPPALTAPPQPGAPVARAAETARTLPAVQQSETTAPAQEPSPAPDLDDLARQVYAVLKRRLAAERRRNGW